MSVNKKATTPTFAPAIARLREIAAQSGYALLTEGPVNPDHELLELCADALHHLGHAQKADDARRDTPYGATDAEHKAYHARNEGLYEEWKAGEARGKPYLPNITKLKAQTAAGIYAKAAVVKASKTGAACLARSLAEDLLACPGLREALWPAQKGRAA